MVVRHLPSGSQLIAFIGLLVFPAAAQGQNSQGAPSYTLRACIEYALKHQPVYNQSLIGISIARTTNAINLAGWLPQVNLSANLIHYTELPTTFVTDQAGGPPVAQQSGVRNTSQPALSVTQAIFSPSLLYAANSAGLYLDQARQISDSSKIALVVQVTKSFYSLLLTIEQISIYKEDTVRLSQSVTDAYHQFVGGIVDETDYDEASISLNNAKAQLRSAMEHVFPQYAQLKQYMGYPPGEQFNISFDTAEMMRGIYIDTTQPLQYDKRIEFSLLQTTRKLQQELVNYYRLSFLPTLSAFYDYNYPFANNQFSELYSHGYPNSLIGMTLNLPIFTGFARLENIHRAKLQEQIVDWTEVELRSIIYSQYAAALADYKSNLYNLFQLQDNVERAQKVYFIVELQYKQGIVPYLNVITAESNLIASRIGYLNALYQVLSNKVDLQKAMGSIAY